MMILFLQHGADSHPLDNTNLSAAAAYRGQASGGASRRAIEHVPEPEVEGAAAKVETEPKKKKTWNPFSRPRQLTKK